jgi:hypothetical protein
MCYDRFVKLDDENKTIGIILCQDKSDTLVETALPKDNKQVFARKYQTVLPSKEELKKIIEQKNNTTANKSNNVQPRQKPCPVVVAGRWRLS